MKAIIFLKKDKIAGFIAKATVFFAGGFAGLVLAALAMLAVLALLGLI